MKTNNLNLSSNNYNQIKNSQIIKDGFNTNMYIKKINVSTNNENKKK